MGKSESRITLGGKLQRQKSFFISAAERFFYSPQQDHMPAIPVRSWPELVVIITPGKKTSACRGLSKYVHQT